MLLAVDRLTVRQIVKATKSQISRFAVDFVQKEIFSQFGMLREIVSDNDPTFIADAFEGYLKKNWTQWKPVSTYAPQANGRAERTVETMMSAIAKVFKSTGKDWDQVIGEVLQSYRVREGRDGLFPFNLINGVEFRMRLSGVSFIDMVETKKSRAITDDF